MAKFLKILFLSFIFVLPSINAMDGNKKPSVSTEQIEAIIRDSNARMGAINPQQIIANVNASQALRQQERNRADLDSYMDKKKILVMVDTPLWPVGIIKRDLYDIALMGVNYLIDKLVFDKLQSMRIEHICNIIIENPGEFEEELIKLRQSNQKWAENILATNSGLVNVASYRALLEKPMNDYLSKKHKLIYANPFKKELLIPYLIRFVTDIMIRDIETKDLQYNPNLIDFPRYLADAVTGSQQDASGQWQSRFMISAFSIVRLGKLFFNIKNPYFFWTDAARNLSVLGSMIKFSMIANTPDANTTAEPQNNTALSRLGSWCSKTVRRGCESPYLPHAIDILAIATSAKIFDEIASLRWSTYVIANRDKFIDLLADYKKEKAMSAISIKTKEAEAKLKVFISAGHQQPLNSTWKVSRVSSRLNLATYTLCPLLMYVGWKAYRFYRNNFN